LQVHIGASEIIRRHAGGRIGIDTDHFRIPLLFILFCGFRAASGRFFMVFDLTLPDFPGKSLFLLPDARRINHRGHRGGMNYRE
jgi:hypothetical protein